LTFGTERGVAQTRRCLAVAGLVDFINFARRRVFMERSKENALGDVTTAATEFGLQIVHVEIAADEFGRADRVLKATLAAAATTIGNSNRSASATLDVVGAMGWDAVLHADTKNNPRLWVRLDPKAR
jgi:hypothetical protein